MRVCLFEDRGVANLEPLTLTRPAFHLICGQTTLGTKQCRFFAASEVGVLIRPYLAELHGQLEPATPVNDCSWLRAGPTILVNGRWLPPPGVDVCGESPCVGLVGEEVAYARVGPELLADCTPFTLADCLESWKQTLPCRQAGGRIIDYLWELLEHNRQQLCLDFDQQSGSHEAGWRPSTLAVVGPAERLLLDPTARLDPMVVADTTRGPVIIDRDVTVTAFSRLEGPCYLGPGSHILGAKVRAGTTLGPYCRIGGEVEASIILGQSNKYHEGFLGHSYLGEWVNLGAGTHSSDLRNDYGEVTVTLGGRQVSTGLNKVGCFIGDHAKTGLATLLNTGTNVGIFCNLLPTGRLLPKYVPSFCSWWNGMLADKDDLSGLLHTAELVMQRRGQELTEAHVNVYRYLFERSADERYRALREADQRRLRRSA